MALTQQEMDAIDRLENKYNGNPYDVSTNPGGMDNDGHRINFIDSLADVSKAGVAVGREAGAAADSAAAAATSEANASSSEDNAAASEVNAALSADEARLYDGKKVDVVDDISSLTSAHLAVGEQIRCIENGAVYERFDESAESYTFSGDYADYTINYEEVTGYFTLVNGGVTYAVKNIKSFVFDDQTVAVATVIADAGTTLASTAGATFVMGGKPALDYRTSGGIGLLIKKSDGHYTQEWFGIKNNGDPHAAELEDALHYIGEQKKGGIFHASHGRFYFEKDFSKPVNAGFEGVSSLVIGVTNGPEDSGTVLCTIPEGVYAGDTLCYDNVNKETGDWISQFANTSNVSTFRNCVFDFSLNEVQTAVHFAGSHIFEYIRCIKIKTLLKKNGQYTDGIVCREMHCLQRADQVSPLFLFEGLGDKIHIDGVAFGYTGNQTGTTQGIHIAGGGGVSINRLVQGHHVISNSEALSFTNSRFETGSVTAENTFVDISNNVFWKTQNGDSQIILKGSVFGNGTRNFVGNNNFKTRIGWSKGAELEADTPDIRFEDNASAVLFNNTRSHTVNGSKAIQTAVGCKISVPVDGMDNDFNRYSAYVSDKLVTVAGNDITLDITIPRNNSAYAKPTLKFEQMDYEHPLQGQTVHFNMQVLTCPVRRYGRRVEGAHADTSISNIEIDIPATDNTDPLNPVYMWPVLEVEFGSFNRQSNIAIEGYLGPSDQSYDQKALLPLLNGKDLIIGGVSFSGQPWESRAAGDMDPLQGQSVCGSARLKEGIMILDSGSLSLTDGIGSYKKNDQVVLENATALTDGTLRTKSRVRLQDGADWVGGVDYHDEQVWVEKTGYALARKVNAPPATPTSSGGVGDFYMDANGLYVCHSANSWMYYPHNAQRAVQSNLRSLTSTVNAYYKTPGKEVFDETNEIRVYCRGSAPGEPWYKVSDDTLLHTPV